MMTTRKFAEENVTAEDDDDDFFDALDTFQASTYHQSV